MAHIRIDAKLFWPSLLVKTVVIDRTAWRMAAQYGQDDCALILT
jgi:hypothetical protein